MDYYKDEEGIPLPRTGSLREFINNSGHARILIFWVITPIMVFLKLTGPLAVWSWWGITCLVWLPIAVLVPLTAWLAWLDYREHYKNLE